jgi:integrase
MLVGLQRTQRWISFLEEAGIRDSSEPVYWSFWKDNKSLRGRLSERRLSDIVRSYYIQRNGVLLSVAPHDLRRTFARTQYLAGLDIVLVSRNMGHSSIEQTRAYIGDVNVSNRRNRLIFKP